MKKQVLTTAIVLASVLLLSSYDLPRGWFPSGSKPGKYEMRLDKDQTGHKNVATIKSIDKRISGFGTLMQQCEPGKYLGKRVRMSGYMKTDHVKRMASFWFRVDQKGSEKRLAFDNMYKRKIKGTTEWTKYEIVLDVPENASNLAYGALLDGTGQLWFDDITFEIVDQSIAVTSK